MARTLDERLADVRALVVAARLVANDVTRVETLAASSGLSREGVALALAHHLELDPSDAALTRLVLAAGDAPAVHVILSATVFVAALRALAIARAASTRVTVHPSKRDPTFARALVIAARDPAITLAESTPIESIETGEIHVYGRDETIAAVRARARGGVVVKGHGAGIGVAFVSPAASPEDAARAIARDVVPFDQRGCLSPRIVLVEGDDGRAEHVASELDVALTAEGRAVPRGQLSADERAESVRYIEAMAYAGRLWQASRHVVGWLPCGSPLVLPPPGRHLHVATVRDVRDGRERLEPLLRYVVALGTDDETRAAPLTPEHARVSQLGEMQRPPLDGPVDRRYLDSYPR